MDAQKKVKPLILMAVFFIVICLSNAISSYAEDDQTDLSVDNTLVAVNSVNIGASTYQIPIEVPPGRKGVEPKLSLTYSSYSKNGWVGPGWNLDVGSIERSYKRGLNNINEFVATFNGTSTVLVRRTDWGTTDSYYGAKIEGAFTKYYYNSSTYGWEATTKDGTKYYFGTSAATRYVNTYGIQKWCLDKVLDTNGNYMVVSYTSKDSYGNFYPYRMYYTYNSGLSYTKYVQFGLVTRTDDVPVSYKTGTAIESDKLLSTIKTYADGTLAREYDLTYETNPITQRSRLSQVKEKGSSGESTIKPTIFTYFDGGDVTFNSVQSTPLNDIARKGYGFGDINKDGKRDFIKYFELYNSGDTYYKEYAVPFISNGDGTFTEKPLVSLGSYFIGSACSGRVFLADVNGDGYSDIVRTGENHKVYTYIADSDGDGTFSGPYTTTVDTTETIQQVMVADIDEDGSADLIELLYSGTVLSCLSKSDGTFESSGNASSTTWEWGEEVGWWGDVQIADVTGDGSPDLIGQDYDGYIYVYKSNGDGFFSSGCCKTDGGAYRQRRFFADVNGDGLADLIDNLGSDGEAYVFLSKGNGYFADQQTFTNTLSSYSSVAGVADINGDGLADLFMRWLSDSYFALSNGDGTFSSPIHLAKSVNYAVDVNGDGMADLLFDNSSGKCMCVRLAAWNDNTTVVEQPADYLRTVTNEYGGITTLTYGKISDFPGNDIPFPMFPVIKTSTNDNNGVQAQTGFYYTEGRYDTIEREFWGFGYVMQTNPDLSITEAYYNADDEYQKGKPLQILNWSPKKAKLLKNTVFTWKYSVPVSGCEFVYLDSKFTETDAQTAFAQEEYTYNSTDIINGNLTSVKTSGTGAENVTKTYTYTNKGTWVWRTATEAITGSTTGTNLIRKTSYGYEAATGNLLTTTYDNDIGDDPVVTNTYDDYGNLETVRDAMGYYPQTILYDSTNTYPETITDAAGHTTQMEWDNRYGKMTLKTDQNGNDTVYDYDGYGRLTQVDYPDGGQVINTYYDTATQRYVKKQVKETTSSYVTSYEYYDGFGRSIKNQAVGENSKTILTVTIYNNMGRVYKTQGPYFSGASIIPYAQTAYDYLGRPTSVTTYNDAGSTSSTGFVYIGFSTTTTDPDGKTKVETKDYLGRVIEVQEDTGGGDTLYTYNAAGDLLTVTDDDGNVTTMNYDTLGRKSDMTDPDMGSWEYLYDKNGNLLTQTDAKGQTITFTYDELNRMTYKNYSTSDPDVTYVYDLATNGIGLLYRVTNSNVTTINNSYDTLGRVTSVTKTITGDSARTTSYIYDYSGKITRTTYHGGFYVTNSYYAGSNLLYQVTGSDSNVYATISNYEPSGKMGTLVQGDDVVTTTYGYNDYTTRLSGISTISDRGTLQNKTYYYSNAGDISSIVDSAAGITYNYGYDDLHRLKTETNTGSYGAISMNYDALGNIESKTVGSTTLSYSYGNSAHKHAVSSINGYGFTYDANGNMLTGYDFTTPSSPVARTMTWNADNMPKTITEGSTTTTLLYDGTGARAKKTTGSTVTYYIGDHYEIKGGVVYKYIFAGNLRVAQIAGSTVSYFHKDHLGSSTVMTNASGVQIESANYEPYGVMRAHTGTTTSGYKFTDQELDAENNLYNYDARLYDPVMGRFISVDPIIRDVYNPQNLNPYAYCNNNPLKYTDPTGLSPVGDWFREYMPGVIGVFFGGVSDVIWGVGEILAGTVTGDGSLFSDGLGEFGNGILSTIGVKEALTEKWVPGNTGGVLPESLAKGMDNVSKQLPDDSYKNGMHSWHSGTNAAIANKTGILMSIFQFLGGIFHESPLDSESFKAEQYHQGTVNHFLDSTTDIIANTVGMCIGYLLPRDLATNAAISLGNYIPGPGEPDPAFGGTGDYKGNPVDAWGQYP